MKFVSHFFAVILVIAGLGAGLITSAQKRNAKATVPAITAPTVKSLTAVSDQNTPEKQRRLDTFLKVWKTLNENYFDPTFNHLNWFQIKAEYEPRVRAAKTDKELHGILDEMINRLDRSHLAIIPPEVYQAIERAKVEAKAREYEAEKRHSASNPGDDGEPEKGVDDPLAQYGIGVELRLINDQFVISRIDKNSAGENQGLKTGDIIDKVNGVSLSELLRRIQFPKAKNIKRYLPIEVVAWFLNGEKDSYLTITYLDETDQPKDVRIRRERLRSQTITLAPNVPERQLRFETASLSNDIGYIRFNFFALPVIDKFCAALTELKDKKALIIDLRGNVGGVLATLVGLSGMLTDKSIDLGTSIYKTGSEKFVAESKAKNFKGHIVFLVDNISVSAAEIFAASLQESGRAIIVGDKTAGEALPSIAVNLPTGAVMQYPIANYRSSKGKYLEGNGVTPDILVLLTRKSLLQGKDDQLEAAMAVISDEKAFAKPPTEKAAAAAGESITIKTPAPIKTAPRVLPDSGTLNAPAQTASKTVPPMTTRNKTLAAVKDADSIRIIGDFIKAIGGEGSLKGLYAYELHGQTELMIKGTTNHFQFDVYRQGGDKYSEIMTSGTSGEIREIHNGSNHFIQTDYGLNRDIAFVKDVTDMDILSPVRDLADPKFFVSLKYQGTFERDGRKVDLVDAKTKDGMYVALAFDLDTKMLVGFTGSYYGLTFGDYQKAGDLMLPFRIERERIMNITLDEIKVNAQIDPGNFERKVKCYDKEN